jgi:acetoin utilization deacetylase AcuC-like enzyme
VFVYSQHYELPWEGHVFPAEKYRRVRERLLAEGIARPWEFLEPEPAAREVLELAHDPWYLDELERLAESGLGTDSVFEAPLTREVLGAVVYATGGTVLACRRALSAGGAPAVMNLAGGFHHAFRDRGEGFCFVNDVAVAAAAALAQGFAERIAVVDCDLHQGNGTARIFRDERRVFTFSIHQEDLYPVKETSDLDVGLARAAGDEGYLRLLESSLERVMAGFQPELVIFLAGADPFAGDQLGDLALTKRGLAERDRLVFEAARDRGAAVAVVLAGGYAAKTEDVVGIHVETARRMKVAFGV